jgi:tetratricopeptide (TPR) repeat protein
MDGTDWVPGFVVLGAGLVLGLLFALRSARGTAGRSPLAARPENWDLDSRDLLARQEALLMELRELDAGHVKQSIQDLARRRYALELEAAEVLRDLDRARASRAKEAKAAAPVIAHQEVPLARRPGLRGAVFGVGATTFAFLLFLLLKDHSAARAPGMSVEGGMDPAGATSSRSPSEGGSRDQPELVPGKELARREAAAIANPASLDAKLDLAQAYLFEDRVSESFRLSYEVLDREPNNPRALTYQAAARRAMGMPNRALDLLDRAVALDPLLVEAWVNRGLVAFEARKYRVAVASWERALSLRPDGKSVLGPSLAEARMRAMSESR